MILKGYSPTQQTAIMASQATHFESFLILLFDTIHLMPGYSYWLCLRSTATTSSQLPPCLIYLKQHGFSTQILQQTLTTLQDPE